MIVSACRILLIMCCFLAPWASAQSMKGGARHEHDGPDRGGAHSKLAGKAPSVLHASASPLSMAAVLLAALPDSVRVKMLAAIARGDIAGAISMWQLATGRNTVPPALETLQAAFSLANRTVMSDNNVHFLVEHEGKLYDAFTGPAGLSRAEYLKNIVMRGKPIVEQVTEEVLTP